MTTLCIRKRIDEVDTKRLLVAAGVHQLFIVLRELTEAFRPTCQGTITFTFENPWQLPDTTDLSSNTRKTENKSDCESRVSCLLWSSFLCHRTSHININCRHKGLPKPSSDLPSGPRAYRQLHIILHSPSESISFDS